MDPPTTTTTTGSVPSYPPPPLPYAKLRLMCSYGGHISPRPHHKSLSYLGGDTRIIAFDRRTTASSLSALVCHLSRTLYNNRSFILKYQLPNEDLDSLISVTNDEDFHNMIEEHDRIVTSHTPSRIRLFLFPSKPDSGSVLLDPKSESWFCDALKSARIMQGREFDDSGTGKGNGYPYGEAQFEKLVCVGEVSKQESMVLETNSSFGSTESSASMSSLPPIGVHTEDGAANFQDKKVKLPSPDSFESSNGKAGINQDHFVQVSSLVTPDSDDLESIIFDPSSLIQMNKPVQLSPYQLHNLPNQNPPQHEVHYVHAGPHYLPQYPTGPMPIPSYYPMYHPHHHNPHNPYPIYVLPVGHNHHTQSTFSPQMVYKDATSAAEPLDNIPSSQKPLITDANYLNEFGEDLACAQIYKSQPPAPALLPQYQTMTMAVGVVLSEP